MRFVIIHSTRTFRLAIHRPRDALVIVTHLYLSVVVPLNIDCMFARTSSDPERIISD